MKFRSIRIWFQERLDGRTDSFGGSLDVPVPDMRVAKRHRDVAMTEQPCDDRDRNALQHGLAREGVAKIVETHVPDAGLSAHAVPQAESG